MLVSMYQLLVSSPSSTLLSLLSEGTFGFCAPPACSRSSRAHSGDDRPGPKVQHRSGVRQLQAVGGELQAETGAQKNT